MKFLFVLLTLVSFRSFATTTANCEITNGIYVNSSLPVQEMSFETIVDIFTLNNAKALNIILDGQKLRLLRSDISVGKLTKMIYLQKRNDGSSRAIHIMVDRTPKNVSIDREFYGNMIISPEIKGEFDVTKVKTSQNLVYNFYCRF